MWYRSYRNHVIMAFPSFDTATNSWAPQANISWVEGPARESAFVRFPMRVASESEAVDHALRAAKSWIDNHRREQQHGQWVAARELETPISGAIGDLPNKSGRRTRRLQPAISRNSGTTLTFDDFKANVARLGANASEHSLLKSYAALNQLRKINHCSWAQIKSKLKHSQVNRMSPQPANRREKSARLPLTLRDWRRII